VTAASALIALTRAHHDGLGSSGARRGRAGSGANDEVSGL